MTKQKEIKHNVQGSKNADLPKFNPETGEILDSEIKVNKMIIKKTLEPSKILGRPRRLRVQQSFENCISRTDTTGAEMTDLNALIAKYSPNELANYIAMKRAGQTPIVGHDFTKEPSLQNAMNERYRLNTMFDNLDPQLRKQFKNVLEFLKFVDDPHNKDQVIRLGLVTEKQVQEIQKAVTTPTPTQEKEKEPTA